MKYKSQEVEKPTTMQEPTTSKSILCTYCKNSLTWQVLLTPQTTDKYQRETIEKKETN